MSVYLGSNQIQAPPKMYVGETLVTAQPWWMAAGVRPLAAYQPKGAASLAQSYVNLANPGTGDAVVGTAPALDNDGWVFDGPTSQRYLLGPNASDAGWAIRFSHKTIEDYGNIIGASYDSSTGYSEVMPNSPINTIRFRKGTAPNNLSPAISAGVIILNNTKGWVNGQLRVSNFNSISHTINYAIGCVNRSGNVRANHCAFKCQAVMFFEPGVILSDTQAAALSTAMENL